MGATIRHHIFAAGGGFCGIAWSGQGICRFQLPSATAEAAERHLRRHEPASLPGEPDEAMQQVVETVRRYFGGEPVAFSNLPLDLSGRDPFFRQVYESVRRLGWGQTTTYGAVAKELGTGPEGARDVGQAMARNPIALIIPCHRVLAAGHKLGGFSAPGGTADKLRMLALEGVRFEEPPSPQGSLFTAGP